MQTKTKIKWEVAFLALLAIIVYLPFLRVLVGLLFEHRNAFFYLFAGLVLIPLAYLYVSLKYKWFHKNIYVKVFAIYLVVLLVVLSLNSLLCVMSFGPF